MALIQLSGVDVVKDSNLILTGVDLTLEAGDFTYLVGRVGSGKTSLIKTLIGEFPVKKGQAEVAGFDLVKLKRREIPYLRRKIGVVFKIFNCSRTVLPATTWNLFYVPLAGKIKKKLHSGLSRHWTVLACCTKAINTPTNFPGENSNA